jgi:hypothetical protein
MSNRFKRVLRLKALWPCQRTQQPHRQRKHVFAVAVTTSAVAHAASDSLQAATKAEEMPSRVNLEKDAAQTTLMLFEFQKFVKTIGVIKLIVWINR